MTIVDLIDQEKEKEKEKDDERLLGARTWM
jgi:hypothetical protein